MLSQMWSPPNIITNYTSRANSSECVWLKHGVAVQMSTGVYPMLRFSTVFLATSIECGIIATVWHSLSWNKVSRPACGCDDSISWFLAWYAALDTYVLTSLLSISFRNSVYCSPAIGTLPLCASYCLSFSKRSHL